MDMACMACFQDHVKRRAMPPNLKCRVILPSGATSISIWDASSKEDLQGWLDENLAACEPGLVNTVHEVQVRPDPGLLLTAHAVIPMHPCMCESASPGFSLLAGGILLRPPIRPRSSKSSREGEPHDI